MVTPTIVRTRIDGRVGRSAVAGRAVPGPEHEAAAATRALHRLAALSGRSGGDAPAPRPSAAAASRRPRRSRARAAAGPPRPTRRRRHAARRAADSSANAASVDAAPQLWRHSAPPKPMMQGGARSCAEARARAPARTQGCRRTRRRGRREAQGRRARRSPPRRPKRNGAQGREAEMAGRAGRGAQARRRPQEEQKTAEQGAADAAARLKQAQAAYQAELAKGDRGRTKVMKRRLAARREPESAMKRIEGSATNRA